MRFSVEANTSPSTLFAVVADFANLDAWDPFVRASWLEHGGSLAVGAVYALRSVGGMTLRYRVAEADPPRRVVFRGGSKRVTSTDTIEVDATGTGSRVTVTSTLVYTGWARLAAPLIWGFIWLGGRFGSLPALRKHLSTLGERLVD